MVAKESKERKEARRIRRERIDADPPHCAYCSRVIEAPRRYNKNVRYCSDAHLQKANRERDRERAALAMAEGSEFRAKLEDIEKRLYGPEQTRKGPLYVLATETLDQKTLDAWTDHRISDVAVGKMLGGGTPYALGKVRKQLFNERLLGVSAQNYDPDPTFAEMLGPSDDEMRTLARDDPAAFEAKLDQLVDAFVRWRTHFFAASAEGTYITKPVHRRWIRAILASIYLGSRTLILSPPRHGKTDLLIHFCDWQIIRNPMVRILWVGPNGDIAENCLGQVRNILDSHEELKKTYLAPGQSWAPQRRNSGVPWTSDKFTVATRPQPLKQPTMWCAGVEGKILSLDADFIVVDDPADPDRSYTQGGRDKIENWFKQKLITRKMNHTGLAMISSRVHVYDLYSSFIDSPNWTVLIDRAHDPGVCGLDLFEGELSDHQGCALFGELNPVSYLREQADDVGPALFDMMYLNQPRPEGTLIFEPEVIRAKCIDRSRDLGLDQISAPHYRLVAGLDPAPRGMQATFLWAVSLPSFDPHYDPNDPRYASYKPVYHMVDLENTKAGGLEGAAAVIEDWYHRYDCRLWVIEDNAFQSTFYVDPLTKGIAASLGIDIRPTHTARNKHDPQFGVAGMSKLYHEGQIVLPYATLAAVRKTDMLITQLTNFTGDTQRATRYGRRPDSDILMASWFPFAEVIRRWLREQKQVSARFSSGISYPGYDTLSYDDVPWGQTAYYPNTLELG